MTKPGQSKKNPLSRFIMVQPMMLPVCWALLACLAAAVYYFGLRSLAVAAVALAAGTATEAAFTLRSGKPVTSAVWVSSLVLALSLPPTIPLWMAAVGMVFGVTFGKMVFGGFGYNVFNPAMVGRCFLYITFPVAMTNRWVEPLDRAAAGLRAWAPPVDAVSGATPLKLLHQGVHVPLQKMFFGSISGSLGETCAALIIAGGVYIIIKKSAPWRLALSCLLGGGCAALVLGAANVPGVLSTLLAGAFLFGAFFVVTEPVSGPKQKISQWVYGAFIGALTVVLRQFSNFSEGMMFAVLFMNMFAPIMDVGAAALTQKKKGT